MAHSLQVDRRTVTVPGAGSITIDTSALHPADVFYLALDPNRTAEILVVHGSTGAAQAIAAEAGGALPLPVDATTLEAAVSVSLAAGDGGSSQVTYTLYKVFPS